MPVTQINSHLLKDGTVDTADLKDGAVTLAKLAALSTKGDLLVYSGSAHAALSVGSDGQVLTADAASANGVKWATPAAGGGSSALVGRLASDVGPIAGTSVGTLFTIAVAASSSYMVDIWIELDASNTSTAKFRVQAPSGSVVNMAIFGPNGAISAFQVGPIQALNTFTTAGYGSTSTPAGSRWARITGTLLTDVTSGNFVVEFSINSATANTVTGKTGSGYVLNKV